MQKIVFTTILSLFFPLALTAQGKRFSHYNCMVPTGDGVLRAATQRRLPQPRTGWDSTRTYPVAVVLMQFADKAFSTPDVQDFYQRIFNEEGYNEGAGPGCVADYFRQQSCGWFHPRFDIFGPVTVSNSYNQGNDTYGSSTFRKALRQLADSQAIDFSPYDWDGDRQAEAVIIVYAGYGGNEKSELSKGCIWPNASSFSTVTAGGVTIKDYSASAELWTDGQSCGIGTICHEYSHTLGLPDLYPTLGDEYSVCDEWDLMDGGNFIADGWCPPCYSAHERMLLGWMEPEVLNQPTTIEGMRPLAEGGKTYLIPTDKDNEFYLLENRQWSGWDLRTPGHGLLVSHVDFSATSWMDNTVNSRPAHHRYEYIHADNMDYNAWNIVTTDRETTYLGGHSLLLSTTPYPCVNDTVENRELTDTSTPAATTYSGTGLLGKPITGIREADGLLSFHFMGGEVPEAIINVSSRQEGNTRRYDLTGRPIGPGYRGMAVGNGKKYFIP